MTDKPDVYTTKTGKILGGADIEQMADEAERGYMVEELESRRRGRPMLGSAASEGIPVRLDPGLRQAMQARAEAGRPVTAVRPERR